jgi:hypothetical protein
VHAVFSACHFIYVGVLLGVLFYPEDGSDMFLRNVAWLTGLHGVISQEIELIITAFEIFCSVNSEIIAR